MRRLLLALVWICPLVLTVAAPARSQTPVDLALVLALDSSASVDDGEFGLQREGLASAFRDPRVIEAIKSGPLGRIAVLVMEWSGEAQQQVDIGWRILDGAATALAFADRVSALPRNIPTGATSIAGALTFANSLLRSAPVEATRRAIDISGDGRNNQGLEIGLVRRAVVGQGVTINALAILNEHPTLNFYFEDRVIGGTGAFVEIAEDYSDYRRAINKKLIREIRGLQVSGGLGGRG